MSWYEDFLFAGLPIGLSVGASKLRDRDDNESGADDTWGRIMQEMAIVSPELIRGRPGQNATLKAMRAIEAIAHQYRLEAGDLPIVAEEE